MQAVIIVLAVISLGTAWGRYRGLTKVVTMPTAALLSFFAGKLFSPLASRFLSHTSVLPPLLKPLLAAVAPRLFFFLLFYIGGRFCVRQLKIKRHFGDLDRQPNLHGTIVSGGDFFTSQVINPPKRRAFSQQDYQRLERVGGALIGGMGSVIVLSIFLAAVGIAGDLQKIARQGRAPLSPVLDAARPERVDGEGLFMAMKRVTDNPVLNMLRSAANPVDDQSFEVFKDYMIVVSNPELMERLLNHPGLGRLTEDPRLQSLLPSVADDPDGVETSLARRRATANLLLDVRGALESGDPGETVKNRQLAAVLSDEAFLRQFTGEFGKILRDVIDSK